jgi:hypothetical protein
MTTQYQYDDSMSDFTNAVFSVLGDWQAGNERAQTSQDTKFMEKAMTKSEAQTYIKSLGPQGRAELLRGVGAEKIMQIMMPGGKNSGRP